MLAGNRREAPGGRQARTIHDALGHWEKYVEGCESTGRRPDPDVWRVARSVLGHFGTLLMAGHDWDRPALWRRSMELLATEVMPRLAQHAAATRAR